MELWRSQRLQNPTIFIHQPSNFMQINCTPYIFPHFQWNQSTRHTRITRSLRWTNRLLSLIRHGLQRKRRLQQFFSAVRTCLLIRCLGRVGEGTHADTQTDERDYVRRSDSFWCHDTRVYTQAFKGDVGETHTGTVTQTARWSHKPNSQNCTHGRDSTHLPLNSKGLLQKVK
jgi:hypothetical protein